MEYCNNEVFQVNMNSGNGGDYYDMKEDMLLVCILLDMNEGLEWLI